MHLQRRLAIHHLPWRSRYAPGALPATRSSVALRRRNGRSTWALSAVAASALAVSLVLIAPTPMARASVQANISYVALGDSYSSGEGLGGTAGFEAGTDQANDRCHRSIGAYAPQLAQAYLTQPLLFYACSGARTFDLTAKTQYPGEGTFQLNQPGVSLSDPSANLVTLTVGGDNAGFSSVLQTCILQTLKADFEPAVVGPIATWLGFTTDPSCADSSSFTNSVNDNILNIFNPVVSVFTQLRSQVGTANTSIIAADYPLIFPDTQAEQTCFQLSPFLTSQDQTWLNTEGNVLDTVEGDAAATAGVNMVDVRNLWDGGDHEVCGNGGAWINGMSTASGNAPIPTVGSFHPNLDGYTGYATAFNAFIQSGGASDSLNSRSDGLLTPQGLPADPDPQPLTAAPAATSATTDPSDSISELTVTPIGVTFPGCEGMLRGGEQVEVTGSGFAPSTTVTVYTTSPGQASAEQQVGQVTSDSTGAIDTMVRIPVGASGFSEAGISGAVIGFDAIGTGADGSSHADAVSMEQLASRRSICGGATPLAGGELHTLAVNADGTVSAWGNNSLGQLGNGTLASSTTPVAVSGVSGVSEVTAGDISSYALTSSGTVYAWGNNTFGQLGDGTTTTSTIPVQVPGLSDVDQIAAGNDHVLALNSDGTVEAWGLNNAGQLGNGSTASSDTPVTVQGLSDVVQVAAGGLPGWAGHSVALKSDGTVWTWGYGKHGQLGQGANASNPVPTQVPGLTGIVQIAANGDNTYALKSDGTVYAWGDDGFDQIGNPGAANNQNTPLQVQNLSDVVAITADGTAALAIKADGTVWAWGDNNTGELGDGAVCGKYCVTPVQAVGLTSTAEVAGGYVHSLAETIAGAVYAWGNNSSGQLGNGTLIAATEPTLVPNLTAEH